LTKKERAIGDTREPTIGELKEKSDYGWSTLYNILRLLRNKANRYHPGERKEKEGSS